MFINKIFPLVLLSFLIAGVTFLNLSILKKEYFISNLYGSSASQINILSLHIDNFIERLKIKLINNNQTGLPVVNLHTLDKSNSLLNKNFPVNIKEWVLGYLKYPNGEYKEVSYRYRGDAFVNWAYQLKSYKIKLKKNSLIDSKRVFNYIVPTSPDRLSKYLPYYLGKLLDLPTPDARLVEMRINNSESSTALELEQLNEGFLRRNKFMPVNLYKAEQIYTERVIEKGFELFNNPSLWTKVAVFNQRKEIDKSDLGSLISLIRLSENSPSKMNELLDMLDLDAWAKFDALQTFLQSDHNDDFHNQRIISDIWKGKFLPVVYEMSTLMNSEVIGDIEKVKYEISVNSLFQALHRSPDFLLLKYQYLYSYLNNNIFTKSTSNLKKIHTQLEKSWARDINKKQIKLIHYDDDKYLEWLENELGENIPGLSYEDNASNLFFENLQIRESIMLADLKKPTAATWISKKNILSLSVRGAVPLSDPVFEVNIKNEDEIPKLYFDADNNGEISKNDPLIPISMNGKEMKIKATFFADRIRSKKEINLMPVGKTINTVFKLISDQDLIILNGFSNHYFTKKKNYLNQGLLGQTPHILNHPIIAKTLEQEIWKGVINVFDSRIVRNPVKIMPGTNIIMHEGASLVFKNHVQAIGHSKSKIRFSGLDEKIWGTIAILGQGANGSIFDNVTMSGGSGYELPNIKFTGMFSLHDVKNVTLTNIDFSDNAIYDDLLHIVYGQNILIKNCKISNSLFDALDIDISQVTIENCNIINSGNDGIDSMSSKVKIKNSNINGSTDKGVSVGEASDVFIIGTQINQNKIGIESKDKSSVGIYNTSFYGNKIDLKAYKKNWQYDGGGNISLLDDSLRVLKKNVQIDKNSSLYIYELSKVKNNTNNDRILIYDLNDKYFLNNPKKNIFEKWEEKF